MNVCILGAGAIGGYITARLSQQGCHVNLIARGETLTQLQQHGIGLIEDNQPVQYFPVNAVAQASDLPPQDLVIIAVKEPALAGLVPQLRHLVKPHTRIVTAMNGIPWWFGAGLPGGAALHLEPLDPHHHLSALMPAEQVIGCVLHMACTCPTPGVIQHKMGNRMILGEALGGPSAALDGIANLLTGAGFDASTTDHIHKDIWFKLWGNMSHNPISALTRATTDQIIADPLTRQLSEDIMAEAQQVGTRIGCQLDTTPACRNQETLKLGAFKTSMLQDVEAGKTLEINALLGAFCNLAQQLGIETPFASTVLGLVRLLDRQLL